MRLQVLGLDEPSSASKIVKITPIQARLVALESLDMSLQVIWIKKNPVLPLR